MNLRIALAQRNATVGDLSGNAEKVLDHVKKAKAAGADLVVFPEMFLPGYPPEDLLLKPHFVASNIEALHTLASQVEGITAVVGYADRDKDIHNAAALLHDGQVAGVYHKTYLPNYAVFDEERYFGAGQELVLFRLRGALVGLSICEDIWHPGPPITELALAGAQLIINISASPYHAGKGQARHRMLATRAADNVAYVAFCNLVGGQDELVFDGNSAIFDEQGELIAAGEVFKEDLIIADLDLRGVFRRRLHDPRRRKESPAWPKDRITVIELGDVPAAPKPPLPPPDTPTVLSKPAEVYEALVMGTRDYVHKNGFEQVVIGLSGGIDSALTAAIAADALGPENVTGVFMPSPYSSQVSREDSEALARKLGIEFLIIPITDTFASYREMLEGVFAGLEPDVTEENIQARIRGNILMALSNKFGWMVLTTGNKSEMSVGYATLYGDMAGGFAAIKDVPKMLVYQVASYRNELNHVIPQRIFDRPPTAELKPDQRDEDTLPAYPLLDAILIEYVEEDRSPSEIAEMGYDIEVVNEVVAMVDRNEYKRRQAAPGIKITPRAFGKDRRLPITNHFKDRA
jgi:NAD+ synthase (glutamine-hydrolysing)